MPYIMPIEIDPPRQRVYRQEVNPHLTIKALTALEDGIRQVTDAAIDGFVSRGSCNIVTEFSRKLPGIVLFRLLFGCSDEDLRTVEPWSRMVSFSADPAEVAQASGEMPAWARCRLSDRQGEAEATTSWRRSCGSVGMEWMADHEYLTSLQILIQGGIGTVANATGTVVRVLAEDPELQNRVRTDRSMIPVLVEERLRLEAPTVLLFRTATCDIEVAGRPDPGRRQDRSFHRRRRQPGPGCVRPAPRACPGPTPHSASVVRSGNPSLHRIKLGPLADPDLHRAVDLQVGSIWHSEWG